ncbi:MAG: hypothetical protein K8S23_14125 [Candidatus Cloacimonetes bacterium]|nr:hypothetical protein [Candidatus Cloacimonadota bacterium]
MKLFILFIMSVIFVLPILADITEDINVQVDLPKFGTYENNTTEYYKNNVKLVETVSKLHGKGFWGKMIANFFPNGKNAEIYNLDEKNIYSLDYDKSSYYVHPIEKYFEEGDDDSSFEAEEEEEVEEGTSKFKTIRVVFEVIDKKEKREINSFNTKRFNVIYLLEKEEIETGKRFIDSLSVDIYTFQDKKMLTKFNSEKNGFNKKLMELVGVQMDEDYYNSMLGLNWIEMMSAMEQNKSNTEFEIDYAKLKKIKGHPVLVEGDYFNKNYDPNNKVVSKPQKKKKRGFGLGSFVDKLAESAIGTVEEESQESSVYKKVLSYSSETQKISIDKIEKDISKIPEDFGEVKFAD